MPIVDLPRQNATAVTREKPLDVGAPASGRELDSSRPPAMDGEALTVPATRTGETSKNYQTIVSRRTLDRVYTVFGHNELLGRWWSVDVPSAGIQEVLF